MARGTNFKQFNSDDREMVLVQKNVEAALSALISAGLLNGALITATLANGANTVNHKLGRKIQGYFVAGRSAAGTLHDNLSTGTDLEQNFVLTSSVACTVTLWVF